MVNNNSFHHNWAKWYWTITDSDTVLHSLIAFVMAHTNGNQNTNFRRENMTIQEATEKAKSWLIPAVDKETQEAVESLLVGDSNELLEAFYSDLEFGTGGLRGIMGVGSMRMNKYTVGIATQGLANYIKKQNPDKISSVAIAHDSRNNSRFFAETAAAVLSANGITVHLFKELRPTPLLSFAVRELCCISGIVITASHNPKEYNGYKVYWKDGAQVLPPHDKGIISEVRAVGSIENVKFSSDSKLIHPISDKLEQTYLEKLGSIVHSSDAIKKAHDIKIVYTSLHGTGITLVPQALKNIGFTNIILVEEQSTPDGNFPTVVSPNPEEKEALNLGLQLAEKENAALLIGTDPDADRVGLAIRNNDGKMVLLNGNQTGSLLVYYQLIQWKAKNWLDGKQYVAKTIVTSNLIEEIAKAFDVACYETLTGFKYIAGLIGEKEGKETFIAGGEESYGYSVGEFVRDKDAVLSAVVLCETAAWCASANHSLWDFLMEMYEKFGLYHEKLISITMKGLDGIKQIQDMMIHLRTSPPASLGGSQVVSIIDVQHSFVTDAASGKQTQLDLPTSNVLQFILKDGSKISARPSGTEPKIKFYMSMKEKFDGRDHYYSQTSKLEEKMTVIRKELGI